MEFDERKYRAYIDPHGRLYIRKHYSTTTHNNENRVKLQESRKECAVWLKFITIFWNPRVLKTAVKFSLAALIMSKYERIGFAVLMLCIAL